MNIPRDCQDALLVQLHIFDSYLPAFHGLSVRAPKGCLMIFHGEEPSTLEASIAVLR